MAKVLVLYYSMYGHVETMAQAVAEGAMDGCAASCDCAGVARKSLRDWFAAIERYPRQLHELEQGEYLDMKRREYSRLQADARTPMRPPRH